MTTVWNTDVEYVRVLAESVIGQRGGTEFEWIILDNGSNNAATIRYLDSLRTHRCVRLYRVEANLGIIGGMRYCLERATGRYVLPLDSDDYLYPDCVRVLCWHIRQYNYPALLYTDEDKLRDGQFADAYFKPAWDPVLFVNSCYIAHLCAIERQRALELGVYTDEQAEGCHDWDTFIRFMLAGEEPRHVPEVVYSWRMHPQSTAGNIDSKSYIHDSHDVVLRKVIAAQPDPALYSLELSPLFNGTPDRWFRRKASQPRAVVTVELHEGRSGTAQEASKEQSSATLPVTADVRELAGVASAACAQGALLHLLWRRAVPESGDWIWEAIGLMELFPDTVMVGGRICRDGTVLAAGSYFGFGRGCDSPDRGRAIGDPGYFAQMWKQHSVSAVSSQHAVIDPRFLLEFIEQLPAARVGIPYLGAWLGAYARRTGRRVVYTPFMTATCDTDWDALVSDEERAAFVATNRDVVPEIRLLSPHLGLTPQTAYQPVDSTARDEHLADLERQARNRRP